MTERCPTVWERILTDPEPRIEIPGRRRGLGLPLFSSFFQLRVVFSFFVFVPSIKCVFLESRLGRRGL